jgi:hypothetical protein
MFLEKPLFIWLLPSIACKLDGTGSKLRQNLSCQMLIFISQDKVEAKIQALWRVWGYLQQCAKSLSHINSSFLVQEEDTHNAKTTPAPDRAVMVSNAWPMASSRASLVLAPTRRKAVLSAGFRLFNGRKVW